ncbi:ATP-binding cassette, subfamily B (MDR/TAP), member 1 [Geosmithia morbida]|uniref:ATP-binding cassette, subfamily B (MDR/TAP), member 1 n=1 Tax=Geosmithia morbida TaxID=1094350 RepID=A0A9P4YSB2_9HYPO|nr:ATP-binding cassette, subfamily B (MDR/TAP), member 1 [Geosmithia morbida]KAF4120922.1 ATP-binding cassette, subfamily B (MDR/TAP), member 1 [Geosmithia morbida]
MQHVQEPARLVFAHDFIPDLPNGYGTDIGQHGSLLSGGQKQRVAIARAAVSRPSVLLLDEATSSLDPHAEGVVQQALDLASEGRTAIVIAHKLATIHKADSIVFITKGRIAEQGTHDDLMTKENGAYTCLVKIQNLTIPGENPQEGGITYADGDSIAEARNDLTEAAEILSRYPILVCEHLNAQRDRGNCEKHRQMSFPVALWHLFRSSPALGWVYFCLIPSCVAAAGASVGQAILTAKTTDVFTLSGDAMTDRGDFFATMFIALAGGCVLVHFALSMMANIFFDKPENNVGALTGRLDSNPQSILELMGFNIGLIMICVVNVVTYSILSIVHSWTIGVVIVFAARPADPFASESILAIRTVSSLAIEDLILNKYMEQLATTVNNPTKPMAAMVVCFALTQGTEYWFHALDFWHGCRLLSTGDVTMHSFHPTICETPETQDSCPRLGDPISLEDVRFSYPLRPDAPVLEGVDLEFEKGQFAAFVGASGCGKSTMIAMLERFYDPSTANINVDGSNLSDLNPLKYRRIVSLVQQEPTFSQGTIRENIALGLEGGTTTAEASKTVSDAQVEAALRASNTEDFVSSLPDGMDTATGSNGTQLSGGQKQRFAIARSLIRSPKILLLDKATSALDTESEEESSGCASRRG